MKIKTSLIRSNGQAERGSEVHLEVWLWLSMQKYQCLFKWCELLGNEWSREDTLFLQHFLLFPGHRRIGKCGHFVSFSTQKSFREALPLMAMGQKFKIVKILSELNFSKFLERLGCCEGNSLVYCLSSSNIYPCLNSKWSVLLYMPVFTVQCTSQLPSLLSTPCRTHWFVFTQVLSGHFRPLGPKSSCT